MQRNGKILRFSILISIIILSSIISIIQATISILTEGQSINPIIQIIINSFLILPLGIFLYQFVMLRKSATLWANSTFFTYIGLNILLFTYNLVVWNINPSGISVLALLVAFFIWKDIRKYMLNTKVGDTVLFSN